MSSLPNTAAGCLEEAARQAGNPHNASEVEALNRRAMVLSGRDPDFADPVARPLVEKAESLQAEMRAAFLESIRFNRSAARRAARARKAMK